MRVVLLSCLVTLVTTTSSHNKGLKALWNLERMAECRLGYTALDYNNYGCWCGAGGSGEPMDGIDECCMLHDKCYDSAVDRKVCFDVPFEYIDDYTWTCQHNKDGTTSPNCSETQDSCKQTLCWCDQVVVNCWAQYPKPGSKKACVKPRGFHSLFKVWEALLSPLTTISKIFIR